MEQRIETVIWE